MRKLVRMSGQVSAFVALLAGGLWAAAAAANPATEEYDCSPGLPKGKRVTIDFNSGHKSITVTFPNGSSYNLPRAQSASGERYVGSNVEIFERGARPLILNVGGQPPRECARVKPR
ncbi:MliC family protein [Bosea sp. LjRoot90]|uniref:MliC family protein n=1 Tax=Bosea sp. LjRoot90 TaxID=3342342 RepID=UPI003ED0BF12